MILKVSWYVIWMDWHNINVHTPGPDGEDGFIILTSNPYIDIVQLLIQTAEKYIMFLQIVHFQPCSFGQNPIGIFSWICSFSGLTRCELR